jgi:hypothetical protein
MLDFNYWLEGLAMSDIRMFVWNDTSAYLEYTADLESGIFTIKNLDPVGYVFLNCLEVGKTIILQKGNIEGLSLKVINLHRGVSHIRCQAKAV